MDNDIDDGDSLAYSAGDAPFDASVRAARAEETLRHTAERFLLGVRGYLRTQPDLDMVKKRWLLAAADFVERFLVAVCGGEENINE